MRVYTLGPFQLEWVGVPESFPEERLHKRGAAPALTLLKALISRPHRYGARDWLCEHLHGAEEDALTYPRLDDIASLLRGLLCPEIADKMSRDALRRHLLSYVHSFSESGPGYRLGSYPLIWVDIDALSWYVEQACRLERFGEDALPLWERAYALARRGEYLPDEPYSDWAEPRRAEAGRYLRQSVHALARLYLSQPDARAEEEALRVLGDYWQQHIEDEDALRPLMELLGKHERYQEALSYYERLCEVLEEEGRTPDARTTDLKEFLRTKQLQRSRVPQKRNDAGNGYAPALPDQEWLSLFTQAMKQGILQAASELEGPLPLNAADRTLRRAIVAALGGMPFMEWMLPSNVLSDSSQQRNFLQEDLLSFFERTVTSLWNLYYSDGAGQVIHEIAPLMRAIMGLLSFAQGSAQHKRILMLLTLGYQLQCCVLRDQMDYPQAHIAYQRAFEAAKELEDSALIASALAREGVTFIQQEQPEQALLYLNAALPLIDEQPLPLLKGYILQALSEAYAKLHQDQGCWQYLAAAEKSVLVAEAHSPEKNVGLVRCNTASIMAQKGVDAVLLQDFSQAVHLISSSLVIYDPRLVRGRARLVAQRAEAYYGLGVLDACIQDAQEALTLAQSVGSNKTRSRIEKLHADLCQSTWRKEESVARLGAMLRESQT